MESIEKEGKTVEDAVNSALEQLERSREEVDIEVLDEGAKGLFGMGSRLARVRITVKEKPKKDPGEVLQRILELMSIPCEVVKEEVDGTLRLEIRSAHSALIIGRKGKNLSSLQYLMNRLYNRDRDDKTQIIVDVEGYRQRRQQALEEMAKRLAEKAKSTRKEVKMEPLNPQDRRAIHMALKSDQQVKTYSQGSGIYRNVVISPRTNSD